MLPFVMGMPCQNVVNMLPMTLKYVVEWERFLLKILSFLCRDYLDRNGLEFVEIHPFTFKRLKALVKTRFAFKKTLKFKNVINLCYSRQSIAL
jgi:hypothetical protein